jgi:octaprenyl-diphosphate synthase
MLKTCSLIEQYAPIQDDLKIVERIFDGEIACDLPFVRALCDTVRSYRGKMLRPALLLLSGKAAGKLSPAHHTLAAVVEMVHMATLVHDDVLDQADERRRRPTIAALSGNTAAVLLGDFLISHAFHLCSGLHNQYASRRIAAATNTVCEGEMLQNAQRGNLDLTEGEYFEIIARKTGVLTAVCCELGAKFSGADDGTVSRMQAFGQAVGTAFQIVDDLLDIGGDAGEVGKTLGRDLAVGTLTLPVIHYLASVPRGQGDKFRAALGCGHPPDRCELAVTLEAAGSMEYALSAARRLVFDALDELAPLPAGEARQSLSALTEFILQRRQ